LPTTQIGRALRELDILWIAAHSPQAKGRVERSFGPNGDWMAASPCAFANVIWSSRLAPYGPSRRLLPSRRTTAPANRRSLRQPCELP
jgi:hypothetical protein